ncbi:sulfotransferase family protein, partial [Aliarcobacter skirrowii]
MSNKNNICPSFLIIGAQKAGTTALYDYLGKHPEIVATEIKEHHYFSCDKNYKNENYYHKRFPELLDTQITFDASPSYLHSKDAYKRIFNYNKNIKIIVLIRNPIERSFSAWNMYINRYIKNINWYFTDWVKACNITDDKIYHRRSLENIFDFTSFVKEELDFLKRNDKTIVIEAPILSHGLYEEQLKKYFSLFKKEQILIIENNELMTNTFDCLKNIESFLEISHINWDTKDIQPIFVGDYKHLIPKEAIELLEEYYFEYNERLFELINKKFNWNNQIKYHDKLVNFNEEHKKEIFTKVIQGLVKNQEQFNEIEKKKSQELSDTKQNLQTKEQELSQTKQNLQTKEQELNQTKQNLQTKEQELNQTKQNLQTKEQELNQ